MQRLVRTSEEKQTVSTDPLFGSCLCGAVRYEVRKPYLRFAHCYCGRCRKATGASHATNLYVAPAQFSWLSGAELVRRFDLMSAASFGICTCALCGSRVPHSTRNGQEMVIPAGTLDSVPDVMPQLNIFWESRAAWACSGGDLPNYAEYPSNWR